MPKGSDDAHRSKPTASQVRRHPSRDPGRAALQHRHPRRGTRLQRGGRRQGESLARLGHVPQQGPSGSWPPSRWKRRAAISAAAGGSIPAGSSRWPRTSSSAPTATCTGRRQWASAVALERLTLFGLVDRRRAAGALRADRRRRLAATLDRAWPGRGRHRAQAGVPGCQRGAAGRGAALQAKLRPPGPA